MSECLQSVHVLVSRFFPPRSKYAASIQYEVGTEADARLHWIENVSSAKVSDENMKYLKYLGQEF